MPQHHPAKHIQIRRPCLVHKAPQSPNAIPGSDMIDGGRERTILDRAVRKSFGDSSEDFSWFPVVYGFTTDTSSFARLAALVLADKGFRNVYANCRTHRRYLGT